MSEGEQLQLFIENQTLPKVKIAEALGMSRQNLFQMFKSQILAPETKKKFEDYFKTTIFTKESFNPQGSFNRQTRIKPLEEGLISNDYVQALKAQIALLEKVNNGLEKRLNVLESNLNEVLSNQKVIMTMLTVAMRHAADFYASGNKLKANALKHKMMTDIASATK